jgi:hypothetical protein
MPTINATDLSGGYASITHRVRKIASDYAPVASPDPSVLMVEAIDSTHVRITWASPLISNAALECTGIYEITPQDIADPEIEVLAVELESDPVISVLLTTSEMHDLADYDLTIHVLEVA